MKCLKGLFDTAPIFTICDKKPSHIVHIYEQLHTLL